MAPTRSFYTLPIALLASCFPFFEPVPEEPLEPGDNEALYAELEVGRSVDVIRAASFGIAEISADAASPVRVVHVRLTVANRHDRMPWTVDAVNAALGAVGKVAAQPLFINSDITTLPIVRVERGEVRDIDFYFPVPDGIDERAAPSSLELRLRIDTPERNLLWYTRIGPAEMAVGSEAQLAGRGARWWANPEHPWPAYNRRPGRKTHRVPREIGLSRLPLWDQVPATSGPRAIRNQSSRGLRELRLSPIVEQSWEASLIDPLATGAEVAIAPIACMRYDVLVVDDREQRCVLPLVHLCFGAETWAIDDVTLEHCFWRQ